MPQFVRPDPMPPDPGLLEILSTQNKQSTATQSTNPDATTSYLSYHLHPGASTASVLYANWLGNEHKNTHLFGLQGKCNFQRLCILTCKYCVPINLVL